MHTFHTVISTGSEPYTTTPGEDAKLLPTDLDDRNKMAKIFANIRATIAPYAESETLLSDAYRDLRSSITELENILFYEPAKHHPLITAQKLEKCIQDTFDNNKTIYQKEQSIKEFKNQACDEPMSPLTKGAIIGAIAGVALWVAVVAGTGGIAALFTLAALPALFISVAGMSLLGLRIGVSARPAAHHATAAGNVSNNLNGFITQRHTFFSNKTSEKTLKSPNPETRPALAYC